LHFAAQFSHPLFVGLDLLAGGLVGTLWPGPGRRFVAIRQL
jgi:hypothetical protein